MGQLLDLLLVLKQRLLKLFVLLIELKESGPKAVNQGLLGLQLFSYLSRPETEDVLCLLQVSYVVLLLFDLLVPLLDHPVPLLQLSLQQPYSV